MNAFLPNRASKTFVQKVKPIETLYYHKLIVTG